MDVNAAIRERRSVRRYAAQAVSNELINRLVEAASYAPSAHNGQPWEFCVTRDPEKKQALAEKRRYAAFLPDAGAVIAVFTKTGAYRRPVGEAALQYFEFQDTAAAIQNLLLTAQSLGLGTCWVGDFDDDTVRGVFQVPAEYIPVAVIAIGYPAAVPAAPARRPVSEILHWERF